MCPVDCSTCGYVLHSRFLMQLYMDNSSESIDASRASVPCMDKILNIAGAQGLLTAHTESREAPTAFMYSYSIQHYYMVQWYA